MATYLDGILAYHRRRAAADRRPLDPLAEAAAAQPPARPFAAAIGAPGLAVIAEIKRRSPSLGRITDDLDPAAAAVEYERGGAACLSVLTDREHFGGSPADLAAAREATRLPVLRKDFAVSPADICDARLMGADAVLLIAAALAPEELGRLSRLASELGIATLVEVHDEAEIEAAACAGASAVGVNQRNLATFEVDPARAERLRPLLPPGMPAVAESGIKGALDAARIAAAGYDAVLVGEHLVRAADRRAAVGDLVRAGSRHAAAGRA